MDIATTTLIPPANTTAAATTITSSNPKSPDAEIETPTRIHSSTKPLSFTNGVLKRHHHHHHHHHSQNHHAKSSSAITTTTITKAIVVAYKECLKNHAATLGGHALDGCGEFMPCPTATPNDPTSLKCAACGCHRNFHRRDPDDPVQPPLTPTATQVIEYQPLHRHHPPPPPRGHSPSPPSPPPISSSYYPSSAPHMLLALSAGLQGGPPPLQPENSQSMGLFATPMPNNSAMMTPNGRKRFRTKFSQGQKEKMLDFAERVGWKMQKRDEEIVADFCNEIGVDRSVLKVWMHNNKAKSAADHHVNGSMNTNIDTLNNNNNNNTNHNLLHNNNNNNNNINDDDDDDTSPHLATNGSSSSS